MEKLIQIPAPGTRLVCHVGDILCMTLRHNGIEGEAFVRTNLGSTRTRRLAIVADVEENTQTSACAEASWRDFAMLEKKGGNTHVCELPLDEVGVFEAKCTLFVENEEDDDDEDGPSDRQLWPEGENVWIKVEPAETVCNNTIYNAFVRQFGKNAEPAAVDEDARNAEAFLDARGYTVIPPSGHFCDVTQKIPFIMREMGFRILQFLPIQPTPTSYGRMGRYGSVFAPTDYTAVDPALADFNRAKSPLEQFGELVDAVHRENGLVFLDLPIDHTGWASRFQNNHPEWFCREGDGTFTSPGAWGIVWEDLCKLDFSQKSLWIALADVFLFWTRRGVDGFRCDAGYMVPEPVWRYIIAKVRLEHPDTIFFLEGLGGSPLTTELLLQRGMNWAYSELFQEYTADSIGRYLKRAIALSSKFGTAVNFAETHDNDRLAAKSPAWAKLRTTLTALTAPSGAFGIANGVEWLATEKIDVHGASSLNWGASPNLVAHLTRLNTILRYHPAFRSGAVCQVVGDGTAVGMLRKPSEKAEEGVLVIVNPNDHESAWLEWEDDVFHVEEDSCHDLLSESTAIVSHTTPTRWRMELPPGECVCLSASAEPLQQDGKDSNEEQFLRQLVVNALSCQLKNRREEDVDDVWCYWLKNNQSKDEIAAFQSIVHEIPTLADTLRHSARAFLTALGERLKLDAGYVPLVTWRARRDAHRVVCLPQRHFLEVVDAHRFRVDICDGDRCAVRRVSFRGDDGLFHTLIATHRDIDTRAAKSYTLRITIYEETRTVHINAPLRSLAPAAVLEPQPWEDWTIPQKELTDRHCALCTNRHGSYGLVRGHWGTLHSTYDAFLAANLNPDHPEDRTVLLRHFQVWVVHRGISIELTSAFLEDFTAFKNGATWSFKIPQAGIQLSLIYELDDEANSGTLEFRLDECYAPDVFIIVRPYVDWRSNHDICKAYTGPEEAFAKAVTHVHDDEEDGFLFHPWDVEEKQGLYVSIKKLDIEFEEADCMFMQDGMWKYQCHLSEAAQRGLPCELDVFSPGYLAAKMSEDDSVEIGFRVDLEKPETTKREEECLVPPFQIELVGRMMRYVVKRDDFETILAGYPWFLDWGRDTLICLRGLVAVKPSEALKILSCFAQFEDHGTLPNMIRGKDSSDRATSDAPLWFFVVLDDLVKKKGKAVLKQDCGNGRTYLDVMTSIVNHYHASVSNGIHCDVQSGLIYSPPHFTWMDTNYPAGTPRAGYPVEIQALWLHALSFMARMTGEPQYKEWLETAKESFLTYFVREDGHGLVDCRHGDFPVANAVADDAIRPNQLFAVTLCGEILPQEVKAAVVAECAGLVIPGGLRSLSDEPVQVPVPVVRDGVTLNDPLNPYWGTYGGDEDTRRKAAYHNGTAWGWLLPVFCEALCMISRPRWKHNAIDNEIRCTAMEYMGTMCDAMREACLGHIPEIYDGDAPHTPRGCYAQAWSLFETYRLFRILEDARNQ